MHSLASGLKSVVWGSDLRAGPESSEPVGEASVRKIKQTQIGAILVALLMTASVVGCADKSWHAVRRTDTEVPNRTIA